MARKIYDLAVKTGEYTDRSGATKGRWQNVGALMEDDNGGKFIMLSRTFTPAGVPFKDGSESILVSMFRPQEQAEQQQPSNHQQQKQNGYAPDDNNPF